MVEYIILRDTSGNVFSQPLILRHGLLQNFEIRRNIQTNVVNDTEFVVHVGRVNPINYPIVFRVRPKEETETINVSGVGVCKVADWYDLIKLMKNVFYDPTTKTSTLELAMIWGNTYFAGFSETARQWIPVVIERITLTPDYRTTSSKNDWEFEFTARIILTEA